MFRSRVERRLLDVAKQLQRARQELQVLDEQLVSFADVEDDTRVRALVSDSPVDTLEHREAGRHADAMRRSRAHLVNRIADLEKEQDELLDRLPTKSR